jgi:hypothetical protein
MGKFHYWWGALDSSIDEHLSLLQCSVEFLGHLTGK